MSNLRERTARELKDIVSFDGNIFMLGCGAVGRCVFPLLTQLITIKSPTEGRIMIMDMVDIRETILPELSKGVIFIQKKLTKENYTEILSYLKPKDIFIDCSWDVDTAEMLKYCHSHGILFINTSVEEWEPFDEKTHSKTTDYTLYSRQMKIRKMMMDNDWFLSAYNPTAVIDHGANPGLVSHFMKRAIDDMAYYLSRTTHDFPKLDLINEAIKNNEYNIASMLLGIKVIHISERDTQISDIPKKPNEFVCTWSINGLMEEAQAPSEIGWGTHERSLPKDVQTHSIGGENQIALKSRGINTYAKSWVPSGNIIGYVIRHGEAFSISEHLSVWNQKLLSSKILPISKEISGLECVYRPSVYYVYCPCDATLASLHEYHMRSFNSQEEMRIMNKDIISGKDELGLLIMGENLPEGYNAWWVGSLLDIDETRAILPKNSDYVNATCLQVASSMVSTIIWMIKNSNKGVLLPDDLPHNEILKYSLPFLGPFVSKPVKINLNEIQEIYGKEEISKEFGREDYQFEDFKAL